MQSLNKINLFDNLQIDESRAKQIEEMRSKKNPNRVFGDFKGKLVIKDGFFDPLPDEINSSFYKE